MVFWKTSSKSLMLHMRVSNNDLQKKNMKWIHKNTSKQSKQKPNHWMRCFNVLQAFGGGILHNVKSPKPCLKMFSKMAHSKQ